MRKYCFHFSLLFSYDTFFNQTCNCTVEPIFLFVCEQTGGNVSEMWACESFPELSVDVNGDWGESTLTVRVNISLSPKIFLR